MHAVIDDLVTEGWLSERAGTLRLTGEGEELHARLRRSVAEIRAWVADALPGEDYDTLVTLLRRLVDAFPAAPDADP